MSRLEGVGGRFFGPSRRQCAWLNLVSAKFCIESNSANAKDGIESNGCMLRRSLLISVASGVFAVKHSILWSVDGYYIPTIYKSEQSIAH